MNPLRQAVQAQILKDLETFLPGCPDVRYYTDYFATMSDKAFHDFMVRLKNKEEWIVATAPNNSSVKMDIERHYAIADKWGFTFHERLWMPATEEAPRYLTNHAYLVMEVPIRIASQRVAKKMSIPETQKVINTLTGQPTGDSKGAGFSAPELRLCVAMGLNKTATELMKYRGGDLKGYSALMASLGRYGKANQAVLNNFASGVVSTRTVSSFFTSAHLKNNL